MKKLKVVLLACVACMALVGCIAFTACKNTPMYAIEWKLDEHVTVTADDYKQLPEKAKEGTEIFFTVTPDNGYEIQTVSGAKKSGAKYTFTVTKDTTITVKVKESIESVTATVKDDKVFYAGQTIAAEDVNVSVKYKTNRTETVTSGYYIEYANEGEALAIGDKTATVTYGGVEATLTLPTLEDEEGVVALITLDADGGAISEAYVNALKANAALGHVNYNAEDGVLTFTHKGLTAALALPGLGTNNADGEVTKGLEGDYILRGWNGNKDLKEIPKSTIVSATYKLASSPVLLNITKIYFELGKDGENKDVPYLVIKGEFKLAESAYLFLYEGNDKVELKGDTITKNAEDRNFELKFNMLKVVEKEYKGKWMDIKFVTVVKAAENEGEEDEKLVQEIILEDYADVADFCDTKQMINLGDYDYGFKTYESNNRTYLKAVYEDAKVYTFTLAEGVPVTETVGEGEEAKTVSYPTLVINGQIAAAQVEKYKGKAVKIDFNNGVWYADIDQNGAWTLTITLRVTGDRAIAYGTAGYAHFSIVEANNHDTQLYKDGNNGNFLNKCCTGGLSGIEDRTGLSDVLTGNAIRIANTDSSQVFYIGEGKWGGLIATSRNEKQMLVATTGAKLEAGKLTVTKEDPVNEGQTIEEEIDCAYLVFTGTWRFLIDHSYNEETDLEMLKGLFTEYSVQTDDGWKYLDGCSDNQKKAPNTIFAIHENGTFEVKIALNGAANDSYWYLHYCHTGRSNGDLNRSHLQNIDETTVTVNGQTFSIFDSTNAAPTGHMAWLKGRLIVCVQAAETEPPAE